MTSSKTYLTRMIVFLITVGLGSAVIGETLLAIFLGEPTA